MAKSSFFAFPGVEIHASGHCRWLGKVWVVAGTLKLSATVNAVADSYDVQSNQLSTWRRLAKQGNLVLPAIAPDEPVFAPLVPSSASRLTASPRPSKAASSDAPSVTHSVHYPMVDTVDHPLCEAVQ